MNILNKSCLAFNWRRKYYDLFILANFHIFSFVSNLVEPFLIRVRKLFGLIVQPKVLDDCKIAYKLKGIVLSKNGNLLTLSKLNVGFAVKDVIKMLKRTDMTWSLQLKYNIHESSLLLSTAIYRFYVGKVVSLKSS